jgi:hypothetical protein
MHLQIHTSYEGANATYYHDAVHPLIINQHKLLWILNDEWWQHYRDLKNWGINERQFATGDLSDCSQICQTQSWMQHLWKNHHQVLRTQPSDGTGKHRQLLDPESTLPRWPWQPRLSYGQGAYCPHGNDSFNTGCTQAVDGANTWLVSVAPAGWHIPQEMVMCNQIWRISPKKENNNYLSSTMHRFYAQSIDWGGQSAFSIST